MFVIKINITVEMVFILIKLNTIKKYSRKINLFLFLKKAVSVRSAWREWLQAQLNAFLLT
jgi:hypothetical protein